MLNKTKCIGKYCSFYDTDNDSYFIGHSNGSKMKCSGTFFEKSKAEGQLVSMSRRMGII